MLQILNLFKVFKNESCNDVVALKDITLELPSKGMVFICGKSGSGKSSLLNIIAGIDKPTQGQVIFNGHNIFENKSFSLDTYKQDFVSFVFQDYNLLSDLSVYDNLKLVCKLSSRSSEKYLESIYSVLDKVGLSDVIYKKVNTLSGGEQQRVAIARALLKQSKILLCDEPTGSLDELNTSRIFDLLKQISDEMLVLVVTHAEDKAKEYADRLIEIKDGQIESIIENNASLNLNSVEDLKLKQSKQNVLNYQLESFKYGTKSLWKQNIVFSLILVLCISLTTMFACLFQYNTNDSIFNTIKQNNDTIVQLVKYKELFVDNEINPYYGVHVFDESSKEEDIGSLKTQIGKEANISRSYFFSKNIQDFTNFSINPNGYEKSFYPYSFRELLVIEDFSKLNVTLLSGKLPTEKDEILIYDYMADSMIHYGVFPNLESVLSTKFVDRTTGLSFNISGVIKSNYKDFINYDLANEGDNKFVSVYLATFQKVFASEYILEQLRLEDNFKSIYKATFSNNFENSYDFDVSYKQLIYLKPNELKNYETYLTSDDLDGQYGLLTMSQFKEVFYKIKGVQFNDSLDKDSKLTIIKEFLDNFSVILDESSYGYSIWSSVNSYDRIYIYGVIDDSNLTESQKLKQGIYWTGNFASLNNYNSLFRQFYLCLSNNWKENKAILEKLKLPQTKELSFYQNNPDYYNEGFTDNSPYTYLVYQANFYLNDVKTMSLVFIILLSVVTLIALLVFVFLLIRKLSYFTSLMKTYGVSNLTIIASFAIQTIFVSIISFLISVPIIYGLLNYVNNIFVKDLSSNLVVFSTDWLLVLYVGISLLFLTLFAVTFYVVKFYREDPAKLIKQFNRN